MATQYPGLSDMFYEGPNVFKTQEGYRRSDEAALNNQQSLSEAIQKQQQEAQLHPLKMEYEQQRARQQQLNSDFAEKEQPYKLADLTRKGTANQETDDAAGMDRLGYSLLQVGNLAKANGGSIPLQVQQRLSPEILQLVTQHGPDGLIKMGTAIRENSKNYLGQAQKDEGKLAVADTAAGVRQAAIEAADARAAADRASRERIAAQRLEGARRLLQDKRGLTSDKKSLEQYARDLAAARDSLELDDPAAAAVMERRYQKVVSDIKALRAAGATPRVDLDRSVLQEVGVLPPPSQGTGAPAPTTAPSADPYAGFKIK